MRGEFLERMAAAFESVHIGDAVSHETQVGPLVSAPHRERVLGFVEQARAEGATVLTGGGARSMDGDLAGGYFVDPALIDDPRGESTAAREEIFGPVVVAQSWRDEDDVARPRQRQRLRARGGGLDLGSLERLPLRRPARSRLRLGQHLVPAAVRAAARRDQAVRLRA